MDAHLFLFDKDTYVLKKLLKQLIFHFYLFATQSQKNEKREKRKITCKHKLFSKNLSKRS